MRSKVKTHFIFIFFIAAAAQDIGERCFLNDGSPAICEHISKCKSAQNQLSQGVRPIICGFNGTSPIVCCKMRAKKKRIRISEMKCLEYLHIGTTNTTRLMRFNRYVITGGRNAGYAEFPHMAILGYGPKGDKEFECGGSLISEQFILTAAHCIESKTFGNVSLVRLGDLDIRTNFDRAETQNFEVSKIYPYTDYDHRSRYHDIALIKLSRPVVYTKQVKPACLQSKFVLEDNNLIATGWGASYYGEDVKRRRTNILQKVKLNNLASQNCSRTYGPQEKLLNGFDEKLQICGGNLEPGMDTCQGDSGGPLQVKIQQFPLTYRVVGITSVGYNCGLVPAIYTRVSRYISWIESIVWPN